MSSKLIEGIVRNRISDFLKYIRGGMSLYTDEIKSNDDSKIIDLNGVKWVADNVQTGFVLRAKASDQANWEDFGGSPAPVNSEYIDLSLYGPPLTNDRTFASGTGIATTDNGPNNTFIIDTTTPTTQTGRFYNPTITVDAQGRITDIEPGRSIVLPARVATLQNGNFAGTTFNAGMSIDGVVLAVGDRILIKDQTNRTQNGIYVITSGAPVRDRDFENLFGTSSPIQGYFIQVAEGAQNAGNVFVCANQPPIDIGTDDIEFRIFNGASGRVKMVSGFDIPRSLATILEFTRSGTNAGVHGDLQTNFTTGSTISVSNESRISIDGKMSGLTAPLSIGACSKVAIKSLNFTGTLTIDDCSNVLISNCVFNGSSRIVCSGTNNNIIIKDCIFIGPNSTIPNSIIDFTGNNTDIMVVNCQFLDRGFSDNDLYSCIAGSGTTSRMVCSGNIFQNTGRFINTSGFNNVFTKNVSTTPFTSPISNGMYNVPFIVRFGYIQSNSINCIISNNSLNIDVTLVGASYAGILSNGTNHCITGNNGFVRNSTNFPLVGVNAGSQLILIADNSATTPNVLTNTSPFTGYRYTYGQNSSGLLIGNSSFYRLEFQTFPIAPYLFDNNQGDAIQLIRGNVVVRMEDMSGTISLFTDYVNFDYFEFNTNSAGTTVFSGPLNNRVNSYSPGYRWALRKNPALVGGGGQADVPLNNFPAGTGLRFPGATDCSAVLEWNGREWTVISLINGVVVY